MHGVIGVVTHWSRESVWSRIREAVEIHALLPNIDRPAEYGNSMPDIVRDRLAYQNTEPPDVIVHATPSQITRCDEAHKWLLWVRMPARKGYPAPSSRRRRPLDRTARIPQPPVRAFGRGHH